MENSIRNVDIIKIEDNDSDEENNGFISIDIFKKSKVGLQIYTEEDGKARIWLSLTNVKDIISALNKSIEVINNEDIKFEKNERINVATIIVKDTKFDIKNDGMAIIDIFNKQRVGLCISLTKGADSEIWLDTKSTKQVISALCNGIKEIF